MHRSEQLDAVEVLVLEDDFYIADDTRRALEQAGAKVMGPYADAADAIVAAEHKRPSCALVDINLGRGANFAPAKALLARGIPVIVMTGYDLEIIPEDLGASQILQKPTTSEAIVAAVEAAPRARSAAARA